MIVNEMLTRLSSPFLLLSLLSVGMQINFSATQIHSKMLTAGLCYKLVLAPLLIYFLYHFAFDRDPLITTMSVIGAAIGPMNTAAVIAGRYHLNANLASQMVAIGIPLSLPIIYIIYLLLH